MKRGSIIVASLLVLAVGVFSSDPAYADVARLSTNSWDPGLRATSSQYYDTVHAWGMRRTAGAWGAGPVNYQSGATTVYRGNSSGSLDVTLRGTYCPGGACQYGAGSGYKGLVQFWNDPANYIAIGLIHDPGVSPRGNTLMIEGAANGRPVGGYWPGGAIRGTSHQFTYNWGPRGIEFIINGQVKLGPYPVRATNPSISFLAAARNTGDIADTTFTGINFSPGSIRPHVIQPPSTTPYAEYSAVLTQGGAGTGHSAYVNMHDANNNAVGVGIQTDIASPHSRGAPWYIWQRVQDGRFTYQYIAPASNRPTPVTLKWWRNEKTAAFYAESRLISTFSLNMNPRLFFNAEGNARLNGDTVNSKVENVQFRVGDNCPRFCGLNGAWNTRDFNFYGLRATNTNGLPQNGADFTITGTATGIPPGLDWDTTPDPVAGIGMIAQYWDGR